MGGKMVKVLAAIVVLLAAAAAGQALAWHHYEGSPQYAMREIVSAAHNNDWEKFSSLVDVPGVLGNMFDELEDMGSDSVKANKLPIELRELGSKMDSSKKEPFISEMSMIMEKRVKNGGSMRAQVSAKIAPTVEAMVGSGKGGKQLGNAQTVDNGAVDAPEGAGLAFGSAPFVAQDTMQKGALYADISAADIAPGEAQSIIDQEFEGAFGNSPRPSREVMKSPEPSDEPDESPSADAQAAARSAAMDAAAKMHANEQTPEGRKAAVVQAARSGNAQMAMPSPAVLLGEMEFRGYGTFENVDANTAKAEITVYDKQLDRERTLHVVLKRSGSGWRLTEVHGFSGVYKMVRDAQKLQLAKKNAPIRSQIENAVSLGKFKAKIEKGDEYGFSDKLILTVPCEIKSDNEVASFTGSVVLTDEEGREKATNFTQEVTSRKMDLTITRILNPFIDVDASLMKHGMRKSSISIRVDSVTFASGRTLELYTSLY